MLESIQNEIRWIAELSSYPHYAPVAALYCLSGSVNEWHAGLMCRDARAAMLWCF